MGEGVLVSSITVVSRPLTLAYLQRRGGARRFFGFNSSFIRYRKQTAGTPPWNRSGKGVSAPWLLAIRGERGARECM